MGRGLASLQSRDKLKVFMPPKEVLEQLADSCYGDVRSAINSLQFIGLKGTTLSDQQPVCMYYVTLVSGGLIVNPACP